MRRSAREIQTSDIGATIARFECAEPPAMTRQPVNRSVQDPVAVVNVVEYRAIRRNGQILAEVVDEVRRIRQERGLTV